MNSRTLLTLISSSGLLACVYDGGAASTGRVGEGLTVQPLSSATSGILASTILPTADPTAPWTLIESRPTCCNPCCSGSGSTCVLCTSQCDPNQAQCAVPGSSLVITNSGAMLSDTADRGTSYARSEAKAVGAAHLTLTADVAVRPDSAAMNAECPVLPNTSAFMVVADGTAAAILAIGRTTNASGAQYNFIAFRSISHCAAPVAIARVNFDITQPHNYSVQLNAGATAKVFVDGAQTAALTANYAQIDSAAFLHGVNYMFRSESGVVSWNNVSYSAVGSPAATNDLADEFTPDDCSGSRCAGNHAPDCSNLQPDVAEIFPPDHHHHTVGVRGATDRDGDALTTYIDEIDADQAGDNDDDGPDGAYISRDHVSLSGRLHDDDDERMYELHVHVRDHRGGSCDGVVHVCATRHHGRACSDHGWRYREDHDDWDDSHGHDH